MLAATTNRKVSRRGLDWWKRDGDKLLEAWVFVDLLELFAQMGHDPLADGQTFWRNCRGVGAGRG